jgi:hypothetical protein
MSLSNISKEHLNQLIHIPNIEELNQHKMIKAIQRNSNNYGKLKVLLKQMEFLQNEIETLCLESVENDYLEDIDCSFKKIPGNTYYLYLKPNGQKFFSIIAPNEWNTKNKFLDKFFYDYDLTFQPLNNNNIVLTNSFSMLNIRN